MEQRATVSAEEFKIFMFKRKGRDVDVGKKMAFIDLNNEDSEENILGRRQRNRKRPKEGRVEYNDDINASAVEGGVSIYTAWTIKRNDFREQKREAEGNTNLKAFQTVGSLVYGARVDNSILKPYKDRGQLVEDHREDLQRTSQDEKIDELVASEVEYIPTQSLCVNNLQESNKTGSNDW